MKVSKIFDPFMYMSVSLPRKEEKIREIDIIWLDAEKRRTRVSNANIIPCRQLVTVLIL